MNNSGQATTSDNASPAASELNWLLDDLIRRLPGAENAVVLSGDGLVLSCSAALGREDAEHLAALAAGLTSLSRGVGMQTKKGRLRQTVVELDEGYLLVTEAGAGVCLALLTSVQADLGLVAYEMNVIIERVGSALSVSPRGPQAVPPAPRAPYGSDR
jgi:predicted regulator of Ras-like GTPase activity (Roadblock/LC7/MglB family)